MSTRPTVWNRVLARMSGEVSADALEAYRRASLVVYESLDRVEARRQDARSKGHNAWAIPRAAQTEMLCAWNAFALQTLGDSILQADYTLDPLTVGFVPPVTAEQILKFYAPIEGWLSRAGQARLNPDYRLDVAVPSPLPPWSQADPLPDSHARGLADAMRVLRDHAEASLIFLNAEPPATRDQQRQLNAIRSAQAAATFKARYADDMIGASNSREVNTRVGEHIKEALEGFYTLGQWLAMPTLAPGAQGTPAARPNPIPLSNSGTQTRPNPAANPAPIASPQPRPNPFPMPNQAARPNPSPSPNANPIPAARPAQIPAAAPAPIPARKFDIWCLTDPTARPRLERDAQARQALETLWRLDPDPDRTLSIQARIEQARASGKIALATDRWGVRLDHFFRCPWQPAYTVRRELSMNGQRLQRGQQFIFNVSCEGVNRGAPFEREILVGHFAETDSFDYGSPNQAPKP